MKGLHGYLTKQAKEASKKVDSQTQTLKPLIRKISKISMGEAWYR